MRLAWGLAPLLLCQFGYGQPMVVTYPATVSVARNATQQFTTYVTVSPSTVTWSVNGVSGGNATYGTISTSGLYTAPADVPMANVVKVRATSTAKPELYGESTVTITQPLIYLWSTYPSSFVTGSNVSMSLNGSGFIPASTVKVGGVNWTTTYVNGTTLKAVGNLPAAGTFPVTVTQPSPGSLVSAPVNIQVTVAPPAPVSVSVSPASANSVLAAMTQFTATVTGTSNTAVAWSATAGSISSTGLYTAPATMPSSVTVTIRATSVADSTKFAQATVTLQTTPGGGTAGNNGADLTAGRFLEQAAFGPTPQELSNVHAQGISTWLDNQFAMPESAFPIPSGYGPVQSLTLNRMVTAPDQLRQKMAWVLGQIIVISMNKNIYADEYVPYQQILSHDAFSNFRTLLGDITMSPQMGKYLDLANSNKAGVGSGANENYARELMQLFSIGLYKLNLDGSQMLVNGLPVPTYTQADIVQHAAALTGWTYPTAPGSQPAPNNWENFSSPVMETRQANHDTTAKTLVNGCTLPAGQTVLQDTNGVLDCVFNHPNVGPFIATRLIRGLVTSNPTPAFISRIATVFNDNGSGVRGDLKAVLRAILLDPEARQDAAPATAGRLKDPIYFIVSFVRAMNGTISSTTGIPYTFVAMGETVNQPASVFYYYSPMYRLPLNPTLFGPEFQIFTPTESVEEANQLYQIIHQPTSDPGIDLSPFNAVAGNTAQLLDVVDQKLFYGRMPSAMRTSLATAIDASYDNAQRVETALYLAALSGQYQTQF